MNNIYEFMNASPWLSFFLFIVFVAGVIELAKEPRKILKQWNIRKHGYPPRYLYEDTDEGAGLGDHNNL